MNSVSIRSPIESLVVSPTILTHQVVDYSRIDLTEGTFTLLKPTMIYQILMTWCDINERSNPFIWLVTYGGGCCSWGHVELLAHDLINVCFYLILTDVRHVHIV